MKEMPLPPSVWERAHRDAGFYQRAETPERPDELDEQDDPEIPVKFVVSPRRETNGPAVVSLVLGILWLGGIGSILAIIFGWVALREIDEWDEGGRGMAVAGVTLGIVGIGLWVLLIGVAGVGFSGGPA